MIDSWCVFLFRIRRPTRATRTDTLFPCTTLCRFPLVGCGSDTSQFQQEVGHSIQIPCAGDIGGRNIDALIGVRPYRENSLEEPMLYVLARQRPEWIEFSFRR